MYKNLSIRIKIMVGQILLIALVSLFIYSYYPRQQEQAALKAIESKIRSISNMFSIGVGIGMGETDFVAVSEALEWTHEDTSVVYISVINDKDQKIAAFNTMGEVPDGVKELSTNNLMVKIGETIFYKTDIVYQNARVGSLVIGYSLLQTQAAINDLKRTTFFFCIALFVSGVVLSVFISNMMMSNIKKLDNAVKAISSGDENVFVEVTGQDEIGKLASAFNHMMHRLDKSRKELIKYSEQLKKQNEELNSFSYVVSHDLKAPLRAIFKLSEWIEEDLGSSIPADTRKNMQVLRGRVFRLESLINGLLEYSKVGRMNLPVERIDVQTMLKETIDLLNPPPHIKVKIHAGMPVFQTKKLPLQQVFMNLLSNAVKYNDKTEGRIDLSVDEIGNYYRFTVQDNGMGIDPAYHEKVFQIFQTLQPRDKVEGTGVGLSIIKKSVEEMGGTVILESEEKKGAKFVFTWPKLETVSNH
jgi:signal transduction histidine kinase